MIIASRNPKTAKMPYRNHSLHPPCPPSPLQHALEYTCEAQHWSPSPTRRDPHPHHGQSVHAMHPSLWGRTYHLSTGARALVEDASRYYMATLSPAPAPPGMPVSPSPRACYPVRTQGSNSSKGVKVPYPLTSRRPTAAAHTRRAARGGPPRVAWRGGGTGAATAACTSDSRTSQRHASQ